MKKTKLLQSLSFFVVTVLTACGRGAPINKNPDKSFAMVSNWTTSGLINHYNTNTNCSAFDYFVVEGLYRYVRSTDEIYTQMAESMPTHFTRSISDYKDVIGNDAFSYYQEKHCNDVEVMSVKIRDNAKWQNGEDFTAKDVWSYYYMIHPTSSNYMAGVKVVDDKNVEFIWNPLKTPSKAVRELLVATDKCATVKYTEFKQYIDVVYDIVMQSPVNKNENLWGAFNRFSTNEQIARMNSTRNAFQNYSPSWYVATGPFKLQTFSPTQILLVKNDYYWNAPNIEFEKIKLYSAQDLNQIYQLLSSNYLDYYDGFIQKNTLDRILSTNEDLVNLKMFDPGAIGISFNISNPLFTLGVRQAFQYIFDRESIKNLSNPYAVTSYYPLLGMAPSEAETYMSAEHFKDLPKYSFNKALAEELLIAEGWNKKEGKWYVGNDPVSIVIGAPTSHDISSTVAEAVDSQLRAFGIDSSLIKSSGFYANAYNTSQYDLCVEWTDLNMTFSYPTGSYLQFSDVYSHWMKVPRYPADYYDTQKAGSVKLVFKGLGNDTKTYEFAEYINSFYSVEETDLEYLVDVFNVGLANMSLGIQFFQNVTASTINVGRIDGVPLASYWQENRNVTYVPSAGTDDFFKVARTNLVFATNYVFSHAIYKPTGLKK